MRRIGGARVVGVVCSVLAWACASSDDDASSHAGASGATAQAGSASLAGVGGSAGNAGVGGSAGSAGSAGQGGAAGVSGGAGVGVLDDDAGVPLEGPITKNPDLDPLADFEWKESLPGQGTCKAGRYTGTFTCTYNAATNPFSPPNLMVSGPVSFELVKSMSGEFLEIQSGTLTGLAAGILGFNSKLAGRLDCNTRELEAEAVDGVFGPGDPPLPLGMFAGGLTGDFDAQTLTLTGDWALTETLQMGTCAGPWTATFQP